MNQINKKEKGSILYFSVLLLGILFSAGITVTTVLLQRISMIEKLTYSTTAFYAADAGIEKVLYRWGDIEENDGVFNWDSNPEFNLGDGQKYILRKDIDEDNLAIIATGSFSPSEEAGTIKRGIQVSRSLD